MKKRFTDCDKWKNLPTYIENNYYRPNKWLVAIGNDIRRLEEKPGVYVVFHKGILVYIGQSNSPRFRMAQHLSKASNEDPDNFGEISPWGFISDLIIKIKYPSQYGKEAMLEKRLIRRLKPSMNGYLKCNKRAYRKS